MILHESSTFDSTTVRIDQGRYVRCTFKNCRIEYGGAGPLLLDQCTFDSCTWVLVGAARQTIDFLKVMQNHLGAFGQQMVKTIFEGVMNPSIEARSVQLPDIDMTKR